MFTHSTHWWQTKIQDNACSCNTTYMAISRWFDQDKERKINNTYRFLVPTHLVALWGFGCQPATSYCRACQQCSSLASTAYPAQTFMRICMQGAVLREKELMVAIYSPTDATCLPGIARNSSWQHQYHQHSSPGHRCKDFSFFGTTVLPYVLQPYSSNQLFYFFL